MACSLFPCHHSNICKFKQQIWQIKQHFNFECQFSLVYSMKGNLELCLIWRLLVLHCYLADDLLGQNILAFSSYLLIVSILLLYTVLLLRKILKNPEVHRDHAKCRKYIQQVIAYMTLGMDVSLLFSDMIKVGFQF